MDSFGKMGRMFFLGCLCSTLLGLGTLAVASTGDLKLWAIYVSVVLVGVKLAAFAVQYVAFRLIVTNRIRAARV